VSAASLRWVTAALHAVILGKLFKLRMTEEDKAQAGAFLMKSRPAIALGAALLLASWWVPAAAQALSATVLAGAYLTVRASALPPALKKGTLELILLYAAVLAIAALQPRVP
jgi:hypothetical protein